MEFFLNEWSLQSQFPAVEQFEAAAIEVIALVARAQHAIQNGRGRSFRSQRINESLAIEHENFQKTLNTIKRKEVRETLLDVVFNRTSPAPWENDRRHNRPDEYHWLRPFVAKVPHGNVESKGSENALTPSASAKSEEGSLGLASPSSELALQKQNTDTVSKEANDAPGKPLGLDVTDTSIAELAERLLCNTVKIGCLLNFPDSPLKGSSVLDILKNQTRPETSVPSFETVETFDTWLSGFRGAAPYDVATATKPPLDEQTCLADGTRFALTSRPHQHGRALYEDLTNGDIYYVDNLHAGRSAHLEVFTKRGVHRGEATLEGAIRPNTQDKRKNYTLN